MERLENEKLILNSGLLRQNLEPHFLFNNLSVLSGLVKKAPEKADDFLDTFSDVYRYYQKHNGDSPVPVTEELAFLRNYMELMKSRFGNAYQLVVQTDCTGGLIFPCPLQLTVENAIKHNSASDANPLLIEISRMNDYLLVKNDLRKIDFTQSHGIGNEYLRRRYETALNRTVKFLQDEKSFSVKIPIIQ